MALNLGDGDNTYTVTDSNGEDVNGQQGNDTIAGGPGDDRLNGGPGDDVLLGNGGDDRITGDAGEDSITGGPGDDKLTGGSGVDTFNYSFTVTQGAVSESFTTWLSTSGYGAAVFDADASAGVDLELKDGTSQAFFSSQYEAWLQYLVDTHLRGLYDIPDDAVITFALNQNAESGTAEPQIYVNGTALDLDFSDRESFLTEGNGRGNGAQERWYSDTWSAAGGDSLQSAGACPDFCV